MNCSACDSENAPTARFCSQCGAGLGGSTGERRHVTVLFCDIVASTELARTLDPEDLNDLTRRYYACCSEAIERYDGLVANYLGDGVMALFGYPRAHEDDAERAIHAALRVLRSVALIRIEHDSGRLRVRAGVSTGLVVVGEDGSHALTREKTVVGQAPNEAAHLQAAAEPGQVVIAASTRRLVAHAFELREFPLPRARPGTPQDTAWQVLAVRPVASRFGARAEALTPFVGREREIALLCDLWRQCAHHGQALALVGEAGIGKSRVVAALRERLAAQDLQTLHFQCSPHHADSALYPFIAQIERAAEMAPGDTAAVRQAKLEHLVLTWGEEAAEALPLMTSLFGLPPAAHHLPVEPDPQRRKERTLEMLLRHLARLAHAAPVLLIVEDIHWADPTSLDLLGRLLLELPRLRMLLLLTHRQDFDPAAVAPMELTALRLARLSPQQCREMIRSLAAGRSLPPELVEQITAKTDGIPLFVEELTKTVLDADLAAQADAQGSGAAPMPPRDLAIPDTLRDSLLARLDRYPLAKEAAQVGAAIGREFSHELLLGVCTLRLDVLEKALGQLAAAELIHVVGHAPQARYVFKHALVQDAAYDTLLKTQRQQLHGRIAAVLEERQPALAQAQPELLAHHLTCAGKAERAVLWWERAGDQAIRRSANLEAVRHFTRALELLGRGEQGAQDESRELEIRIKLSGPLIATGGYVTPELADNFTRAAALCTRLGREEAAFAIQYGQWVVPYVRGDMAAALVQSQTFLSRARRQADPGMRMMGHRVYGSSLVWSGETAAGSEHLNTALSLYRERDHDALAYVFSQHPRVAALAHLCLAQQHLGQADRAMQTGWLAISEARRIEHFNSLAYALCFVSLLIMLRRDVETLRVTAGELLGLAERHKASYWTLWARPMLGWIAAQEGHIERGIRQMHESTAQLQQQGANLWVPQTLLLEAEILGAAGQPERAHALLDAAQALIEPLEQRFYEAELHRVRATVLLPRDAAAGQASLERAIAVARRQQSRFLELRACISKARYMKSQGQRENARDVLAAALGAFTEGHATADLVEAARLLGELG